MDELVEASLRRGTHNRISPTKSRVKERSAGTPKACRSGGVSTEEIDRETMESRRVPGLYFAGEMVDIDGACGGYNLQWAWSSGHCAGLHAVTK